MSKAEQTLFWEGYFGNEYTERNQVQPEARAYFFRKVFSKAPGINTVCELGANKGHNLKAIHLVDKSVALTGVEINRAACEQMAKDKSINALCSSIQDFNPENQFDLVFSSGVLIHLPPADLPAVYKKMFELSARYVLINEYYNPVPVEIEYRGHSQRLFKRDFGGEFMDANAVRLIDYGFLWQRAEPAWDNTTWWLFEKG